MTIQQAYEQGITSLGRATWGRAAWLELARTKNGDLAPYATMHTRHLSPRPVLLIHLIADGWEPWTHHTTPDLADPPQDDKPFRPLPVPPSP